MKGESDTVVRKTALDALAHLVTPEHQDLAPTLDTLLRSDDAELARGAAFVLANMGGAAATRAVPILQQALTDEDPTVQANAAAGLANCGLAATIAVEDLARAVGRDRDPIVRRNAILALGHLGAAEDAQDNSSEGQARKAVPALIKVLEPAESPELRRYAAEALAEMRYPANEAAIPTVLSIIKKKDEDPYVRQRCVWSLFQSTHHRGIQNLDQLKDLDGVPGSQVLGGLLEDAVGNDPGTRLARMSQETKLVLYDCARVLAFYQSENAPEVTATVLVHMLGDKTLLVYSGTEAKVEGTGNEASRGQSAVRANRGGDARYMAAQALGWLGRKASSRSDVMAALQNAVKDRDSDDRLRQEANKALQRLGGL